MFARANRMDGRRSVAVMAAAMPAEATESDPFRGMSERVLIWKDKVIFTDGDVACRVYRISKGVVRLYKLLPDGRRQITAFLGAGDILGAVLSEHQVCSAEAVTQVTLQSIERSRLVALMDEQPKLMRRFLSTTMLQLNAAQDQINLLGLKDASERVVAFLDMLGSRSGYVFHDGCRVYLPMSRRDVADYLGLTTETVSRALAKLKEKRRIRMLSTYVVELASC